MWLTFFQELGAQVVVSPPTNRVILAEGVSRAVAETCLPVKAFCGHVVSLIGSCDYVFVPSVRSMAHKVHNCSKFLGLPDLTRAVVPESRPLLEVDIDVDQGKRALYQAIFSLGRRFSRNPLKVKKAAQSAWQTHKDYVARMRSQGLSPLQVLEGEQPATDETRSYHLSLAVIGHPYLVYDSFINHRLLERLDKAGVKVYTPEMVPQAGLDEAMAQIVGQAYWTYEAEVVGAGGYYLENRVAGVIGVAAFACGPDSLMFEMVERRAKKLQGCPFMALILDEHTGEAGLLTRLEAFLDMIQRRRQVTACV